MACRFLVHSFVAACALLILPLRSPAQEKIAGDEWVSLFNGKNLDGWTVKIAGHEQGDNYLDTFRVEDGVIKVCYDKYERFDGKFGHLFYKDRFSHYDLRLQYRFVGQQAKDAPGWALRN